MKIGIRIWILSGFVVTLLLFLFVRSCAMPPRKGEVLYERNCASCHGKNGEGFKKLIPPLNDPAYLDTHQDIAGCVIYFGLDSAITVKGIRYEGQPMAGLPHLSTVEITNIVNYVYEKWSNSKRVFKEPEIKKQIENCR